MSYVLGKKSLSKLNGVHPALVKVVKRAIELTAVDFTVNEGVRTLVQQKANVAKGVSQTMNSKHLKQSDGYSHAVDILPLVNNTVSWNLKDYYPLATAMQKAAEELKVTIRWGGAWINLNNQTQTPKELTETYSASRRKVGKKAFIDAPHFEIVL